MLSYLLDTSVYSQRLKPEPVGGVVERWKRLGDAVLAISSITESELHYGLRKRDSDRLWLEYREYLEDRIVILPVEKRVAMDYGRLKAEMERLGEPRADFDLLIAATARVHGLALATLNGKHFEDVPGLVTEDWSKRA